MRKRLPTTMTKSFAAALMTAAAAIPLFLSRSATTVRAQAPEGAAAPAAAPAASASRYGQNGLSLVLSSGEASETRVARLAALYVPAGGYVSPFLPKGAFKATFSGNLVLRIRDSVKFVAEGRGAVKVSVGGKLVLEAAGDDLSKVISPEVKLIKGKNPVVVEYTSPESGDAVLRVKWAGLPTKGQIDAAAAAGKPAPVFDVGFPPEPLPPTQLYHDAPAGGAEAEAAAGLAERGRAAVATLRCVKCHAAEFKATDEAMPELAMDAPDLSEAGARMSASWMAKWIADPRAIRPSAAMPAVLRGATKAKQSQDVAAYLATLGKPSTEELAKADEAAVAAGARLYTGLGCLGCHTAPDAATDTSGRIPHNTLREKYQPAALRDFLLQPDKHYKWIRMGNFKLTPKQAEQLTAYLMAKAPAPQVTKMDGDPAAGKEVFETAGCLSCHTGPGTNRAKAAPGLAVVLKSDFTKGCTADDEAARGNGVDFSNLAGERPALAAFAKAGAGSLEHDDAMGRAEREVAAVQCLNCHARDKASDAWSNFAGEVADIENALPPAPEDPNAEKYSPDQTRPTLTWVGEKLKPEWMGAFIGGEIKYKPRPFLRAVMPAFPTRAHFIPAGLAAEHGFGPVSPPAPEPDVNLAEVGRKLTGKAGGFACNACHPIGDTPAGAAFEAPAINYRYTRDRLTKSFYDRWVWRPLRIEPATRMPSFADAQGLTPIKDVFDGDGRKQYEAIWNYLQTGRDIKAPTN